MIQAQSQIMKFPLDCSQESKLLNLLHLYLSIQRIDRNKQSIFPLNIIENVVYRQSMLAVANLQDFQSIHQATQSSTQFVINSYKFMTSPLLCPTQNHLRNIRAGINVLVTAQKGKQRTTFEKTINGMIQIYQAWRVQQICEGCDPILLENDKKNRLFLRNIQFITSNHPLERDLMKQNAAYLQDILKIFDVVCIHGDKRTSNVNVLQQHVSDRSQRQVKYEEEDMVVENIKKQEV